MARQQQIIVDKKILSDYVYARIHPAIKVEIVRVATEAGMSVAEYLRSLAEEDLRRRGVSVVMETREQIL